MKTTREFLFWLPPGLGAAALCWQMPHIEPLGLAVILGPMALYLALFAAGRAPGILTRLFLSLLMFVGLWIASSEVVFRIYPPTGHPPLPTVQIPIVFMISAALASLWRFTFRRQPMTHREARYLAVLGGFLVISSLVFLVIR